MCLLPSFLLTLLSLFLLVPPPKVPYIRCILAKSKGATYF